MIQQHMLQNMINSTVQNGSVSLSRLPVVPNGLSHLLPSSTACGMLGSTGLQVRPGQGLALGPHQLVLPPMAGLQSASTPQSMQSSPSNVSTNFSRIFQNFLEFLRIQEILENFRRFQEILGRFYHLFLAPSQKILKNPRKSQKSQKSQKILGDFRKFQGFFIVHFWLLVRVGINSD